MMAKAYYQPRGGEKGKFTLRDNTYRRMWYLIADYDYFKACQAGEIELVRLKDERHSPTEDEAINLTNFDEYIKAIEDAKKEIPEAYIDDVMEHIISRKQYSRCDFVHESTLKKWVQRFIWHVARNLGEM